MIWSEEDKQRLLELRLDPARHNREKLVSLLKHFKSNGSVYSVYKKGNPISTSQYFAEKLRNIAASGKLDWLLSNDDGPAPDKSHNVVDPVLAQRHFDGLMAPLLGLMEVLPLPIHDRDIATWFIRPQEHTWPVTKGRAFREGDTIVDVKLDAEAASEAEFELLKQHFPVNSIWQAIEDWKQAMATDLSARFALLRKVVEYIELAEDRGGLGMLVEENLERTTTTSPVVGVYLAFVVYDQILTDVMNLNHRFY